MQKHEWRRGRKFESKDRRKRTNLRCVRRERTFDKCRIGKQLRRVRYSLLNVTGTSRDGRGKGGRRRTIERNRKRPRGTSKRKTNNRINCFFKKGYNGSEGLSRCGIAINSSSENATGQVVERVVRERVWEGGGRGADLERGRKSEICVDADKFVAKYRNIGTLLVSINVVRIYCRVVNSIYIVIASVTTHSSKSIEFVWLLCIYLKCLSCIPKLFVF